MTVNVSEFTWLATLHLGYLEKEFGFERYPAGDYDEVRVRTVCWLGPVGVQALTEPLEDLVEVAIVILQDGTWPRIGPIVSLHIEHIVKARAPEKFAWYYAFDLRRDGLDAYLQTAAADLRLHAADLLRGESLALVDEVRATLQGVRGVPNVDWWVT